MKPKEFCSRALTNESELIEIEANYRYVWLTMSHGKVVLVECMNYDVAEAIADALIEGAAEIRRQKVLTSGKPTPAKSSASNGGASEPNYSAARFANAARQLETTVASAVLSE